MVRSAKGDIAPQSYRRAHLLQGDLYKLVEDDPMKLPRRTFLRLAAGLAALPAVSRAAEAQSYPTRPVRMMVGYPAGYAPDIVARLVAQSLSERLGQQIAVENRPGAGSNIPGRLHAPSGHLDEYRQRVALREPQLQCHPRHRACRAHWRHPLCLGGQSIIPGQ